MTELAQLLDAVEAADHDEPRLTALLAAWRACPHPLLADAVEAVGHRCTPSRARTRALPVPDWLALAAEDRPWDWALLIPELFTDHDVIVCEKLGAMAARGRDPRLARAILNAIRMPSRRFEPSTWARALALVEHVGDPRTARLAARLSPPTWAGQEALAVLADGRARLIESAPPIPSIPPALRARLERLAAACRYTPHPLEEAVWRAPEEPEQRLVFGDWLMTRDDPRGHFIQLQAHHPHDGARHFEVSRLHERRWLGPLAPIVAPGVDFELGFLSRCTLVLVDPEQVRALIGHPSLSTLTVVESVWCSVDAEADARALLIHPVLDGLVVRRTIASPAELEAIFGVGRAPRLANAQYLGAVDDPAVRVLFADGRRAPALRSLHLARPTRPYPWLVESRLLRRLDTLRLARSAQTLLNWFPVLFELPINRFEFGGALAGMTLIRARERFGMRLNGRNAESTQQWVEALEQLPSDWLVNIELIIPRAFRLQRPWMTRLSEWIDRQNCPVSVNGREWRG